MNEYLDYNINSGCFNDVYNAFKTQSELIFLPFTPNWGCKPAHGSVGGTAMTKSVRKYLYWVDYYMCTNFQRVLICFGGLGEPWKVAVAWGSGHSLSGALTHRPAHRAAHPLLGLRAIPLH